MRKIGGQQRRANDEPSSFASYVSFFIFFYYSTTNYIQAVYDDDDARVGQGMRKDRGQKGQTTKHCFVVWPQVSLLYCLLLSFY